MFLLRVIQNVPIGLKLGCTRAGALLLATLA